MTVESGGELDLGSLVLYHTGAASGNIVGTTRQKVKRCYGDFDDDGDVDTADFAIFGQVFGGSNQTPPSAVADADCDHDVDGIVVSNDFGTRPGGFMNAACVWSLSC